MALENDKDKNPSTHLVALRDERESAIARLSDAFAHDLLELEEFERRLGIAHRTDSLAELEKLTADLSVTAPSSAPTVTTALAPRDIREQQTLVAIMGGTSRRGYWTPPKKLRVIAMWGGVELDFREAALGPGTIDINVTAIMGGVMIIVPPQLAVEMDGMAIMGGFEHSERAPIKPDPDRPVLRIHGLAIWGGVHIVTRLPGESERDAKKRLRTLRKAERLTERTERADRAALPPHRD